MLFILVMDVLNALIGKADEEALLQPLATDRVKHRVSLYADDVALFIRPSPEDLSTTKEILQLFGGGERASHKHAEELHCTNPLRHRAARGHLERHALRGDGLPLQVPGPATLYSEAYQGGSPAHGG